MCGAHHKTLMGQKPANRNIKDHLLLFGSLESRTHIDLVVVLVSSAQALGYMPIMIVLNVFE